MYLLTLFFLKDSFATSVVVNNSIAEQSAFEDIEITRLAFGSCYEPTVENYIVSKGRQTSIWDGIRDFSPQVFLWLGDNFYTDIVIDEAGNPKEKYMPANTLFLRETSFSNLKNNEISKAFELSMYKSGYQRILQQSNYKTFLESNPSIRIAALWDDHDFCVNDCFGKGDPFLTGRITEEAKLESRYHFLEFLNHSNLNTSFSDYVRTQKHWSDQNQGIYSTYLFGKDKRKIRVILLDSRYHQDPIKGDLLGEEQWLWLENILMQKDDAAFTIIASSIQYFPDLHGGPVRQKIGEKFGETWGRSVKANFEVQDNQLVKEPYQTDFTQDRTRLIQLIAQSKRKGVVLISGDKHMGTIDSLSPQKQRSSISKESNVSIGYPLFDITSSGLSHSLSTTLHKGTHVVGANWLYNTDLTTQRHLGTIEIDWSNETNPLLTISLRSEKNEIARTKDWRETPSKMEYSFIEHMALIGLQIRYVFRPAKPLSVQLSLEDLSPKKPTERRFSALLHK